MQPFDFSREVETKIQAVALRRVRGNPTKGICWQFKDMVAFQKDTMVETLRSLTTKKRTWSWELKCQETHLIYTTCNNQDRLL